MLNACAFSMSISSDIQSIKPGEKLYYIFPDELDIPLDLEISTCTNDVNGKLYLWLAMYRPVGYKDDDPTYVKMNKLFSEAEDILINQLEDDDGSGDPDRLYDEIEAKCKSHIGNYDAFAFVEFDKRNPDDFKGLDTLGFVRLTPYPGSARRREYDMITIHNRCGRTADERKRISEKKRLFKALTKEQRKEWTEAKRKVDASSWTKYVRDRAGKKKALKKRLSKTWNETAAGRAWLERGKEDDLK